MIEKDYAFLGRRLVNVMETLPDCKGVVACLEGGYSMSSLSRISVYFVRQLAS